MPQIFVPFHMVNQLHVVIPLQGDGGASEFLPCLQSYAATLRIKERVSDYAHIRSGE